MASNNKIQDELKTGPVSRGGAVTPSDTVSLTIDGRGLYVGVTGAISVLTPANETLVFANIAAGVIHPIEVRRVNATGTDATNIVVVY